MLQLVRVMSVPKEFKKLVKYDSESKNFKFQKIKKFQILSEFKTNFLQRVKFQIKFFTTRQVLKQNFHNASDFKSKNLKFTTCHILFWKKF